MPIWLTNRLWLPIWQLWATCTRLSIFVPGANARGFKGAAVDGGASADFHVVADLDMAELRHLDVFAAVQAVAEAVGADDGVGMNDVRWPRMQPS